MPLCHKCEHYLKGDTACLSCEMKEQYTYTHNRLDLSMEQKPIDYDLEEQYEEIYDLLGEIDSYGQENATHLDPDDEDKLRKAMCTIFSLKPMELLLLQAIMNRKTLLQFSTEIGIWLLKNKSGCSRHRAFMIRKAMLKKLPLFKDALTTVGQRKELKDE